MGEWLTKLKEHAVKAEAELLAMRHHLHANPEVSHCERETAAFVTDRLSALGVEPRTGIAGHGVVADLELGPGPKIVAMRADMDALPIQDRKTVEYRSRRDGVMHACGHDLHTTVLLGVAQTLLRSKVKGAGRIRLIFQPAEEATPGGANGMAAAGVMDGVAAIAAVHCDPMLPPGRIGLRRGPATASTDQFRIEVLGRGGHSSRPHQAVDAIAVASSILAGIYQLRGTRIDPRRAAVVNVGRIHGGEAPNAIGDRCVLEGCIRCTDPETRSTLDAALRQLATSLAEAGGAGANVSIANGAPPLFNDLRLAEIVEKVGRELYGQGGIDELAEPSMGGEDFSVYAQFAPALLVRLGSARPGDYVPLHSNVFDVDDRAMTPAVTLMSAVLIEMLADTEIGGQRTDRPAPAAETPRP